MKQLGSEFVRNGAWSEFNFGYMGKRPNVTPTIKGSGMNW